ncbi:MAG: hypothetical protein R3F20_12435 [Planctomycetota bacterium]
MALLVFLVVGAVEGVLGAFGLNGRGLPDLALGISLASALTMRRDRDVAVALAAGLASGLFGAGPWGVKALLCLAAGGVVARWRGESLRWRPGEILARSAVVLVGLAVVEFVWLLSGGRLESGLATLGWLLLRAATTSAAVGLWAASARSRGVTGRG